MKRLPEVPFARGDAQGVSNPEQEQGAQGKAGGLRAFCSASAQRDFGDMLSVPSPLLPPTPTY